MRLTFLLGLVFCLTAQVNVKTPPEQVDDVLLPMDFYKSVSTREENGKEIRTHRWEFSQTDIMRQLYIYQPPTSGSDCNVGRMMATQGYLYVCDVDIYNRPQTNGPVTGKWARVKLETSW